MDGTSRSARLAFAGLLLSNLCLAFGPWLVRLAETESQIGAVGSAFWRVALAAPMLLLLTRISRQPIPHPVPALWIVMALGGLFFAADLAAWHLGILRTKLANAALFGNSASFFYAGYGFVVARSLPGRNQGIAIALAVVGVVLLLGTSFELSPRNFAGDLLCLLAGLFYTGYLIVVGRARTSMAPMPTLAMVTIATVPPLALLVWWQGEPILPTAWTALVLLAIGSQVLGQGLMVYAIVHLSPVVVGLGLLSQPVVAALIGWWIYGERLGLPDAAGAVLIGLALVLVRRPDRPRG